MANDHKELTVGEFRLASTVLVDEAEGKVTCVVMHEAQDDDTGLEFIAMGTGYSSTHPDDKFDLETGSTLALGRALLDLGKQNIKAANRRVNKADKFKRDQKKASEAAIAARKEKTRLFKESLKPTFTVGDVVKTTVPGFSSLGRIVGFKEGCHPVRVEFTPGAFIYCFDENELVHYNPREDLPA